MNLRHAAPAALAALLWGCGSPGPVEPAAVVEPREALQLGIGSYNDQRYFAAETMFAKAFNLYRSLDDSRGQVTALVNLADCSLVLGESRAALDQVLQAQAMVARDGLTEFSGRLQLLKAQALREAGKAPEARAALDALLNGPADATLRQAAVVERARIALLAEDDTGPWLEQARAAAPSSARGRASLEKLEALASQRQGDAAGAHAHLARALELYRKDRYRPGIAATHEELGAIALKANALADARDHYERALAVRLWLSDRVHGAAALKALASIEDQSGSKARAAKLRDMQQYLEGAAEPEWRIVQMKYESLGSDTPL